MHYLRNVFLRKWLKNKIPDFPYYAVLVHYY